MVERSHQQPDNAAVQPGDRMTLVQSARLRIASPAIAANGVLTALLLICAFLYALTTFCAICNFGLHQPMFDQYKEYGSYLSLPLLDAVFRLENGHRPVIPAFVANLEIRWFHADQYLQLALGTCCVFLASGVIAWTMWREVELPRVMRAAGVLLAALGVLWLGNARMLLHGVEQLHAYGVVLAVVVGALCTFRAAQLNSWGWIVAASACCVVAMFTFGAGVAGFPTVVVLAVLLRLQWTKILAPLATAVACLYLYIFALPGHQSVQGALRLRPFDSAVVAARWLGSPWANAWLGMADPPIQPWLPDSLQSNLGRLLVNSANGLVATLAVPWNTMVACIGLAGIGAFVIRSALKFFRRSPMGRSEALATGLCTFALTSAVIFSIGRLSYLDANPAQVYAERYLVWPCLFWTGLSWLMALDIRRRTPTRILSAAMLVLVIALPLVLFPTHRSWAGWGAAVYQASQRAAAAARSDVWDGAVFPDNDDASSADVVHTLGLLKLGNLAMFADSAWQLVGEQWRGSVTSSADFFVDVSIAEKPQAGTAMARFTGAFSKGIGNVPAGAQIAALDGENRIVGLAEFSYIASDAQALRVDVPAKRGFDGYIRDYDPRAHYRIVLLQSSPQVASLLATLPPA